MRWRLRLPGRPLLFALLMLLAAVVSLLPPRWTSWVRGAVQLLGLPQGALTATAHSAGDAVRPPDGARLTAAEISRLQTEHQELRRLVQQQRLYLADLERRFDELRGIRGRLADEGVEILIAPVLGYDAAARRETLLIGRGSVAGVRPGQWVVAGVPPQRHDPQERGELVLRQWLIGRVSEVQPRVSRVLLASDPKFEQAVCVGRVQGDGGWLLTSANCLLSGRGRGRMVITQVEADYRQQGYELVLVPPSADLPATLTIGRIVSSARTVRSALHFDLEVEPWGDPRGLRYVYVIQVAS